MSDDMTLDEILGRVPQLVQDVRVQLAMANQQYRDVKNDAPTVGNLVVRWNTMTPQSQTNAIVVLGLVAAILWKAI